MQNIHLDFNNVTAERIGEGHGITRAELEGIRERAAKCFRDLMEERSGGLLPFLDLPYDKHTTARVSEVANDVKKRDFSDFVVLGIGRSEEHTSELQSQS